MNNRQRSTLVGVFVDQNAAREAVNELRRDGFRSDQIGVAARTERHGIPPAEEPAVDAKTRSKVAEGAAIGAGTGAGLGAAWALGIAAGVLPVVGPVIAGGLLASVLASAAGTAAVGTIVGGLLGLGVSEEEAQFYETEFHAGRTLVTVKPEGRYGEAEAVLRKHGAYDMKTTSNDNRSGA